MRKKILSCGNCGDEIESCDNCDKPFREGDDVICYSGAEGDYHFCSEDCMNEYLDTTVVETTVECYDDEE